MRMKIRIRLDLLNVTDSFFVELILARLCVCYSILSSLIFSFNRKTL